MKVRKFWIWCTEETTKQSKGFFYAREILRDNGLLDETII